MSGAPYFPKRWMTSLHVTSLPLILFVSTPAWSAEEATVTSNSPNTTDSVAALESSPSGHVARAIFTTAIADREPVDQINTLSADVDRVFFFSDLRGLGGQIVTHRWEYAGQEMAKVTFKVGNGVRWRVYSSKNLLPEWTGTWTVVVSSENGQPLQTSTFEYVAQ